MRIGLTLVMIAAVVASCGWRGLNSLPLPGTQGNGPGSFAVQAQLPDVNNIQPNSRVRVADVTVGHVTKIERQGWHALVTMRLDGDVDKVTEPFCRVDCRTQVSDPVGQRFVRCHHTNLLWLGAGSDQPDDLVVGRVGGRLGRMRHFDHR